MTPDDRHDTRRTAAIVTGIPKQRSLISFEDGGSRYYRKGAIYFKDGGSGSGGRGRRHNQRHQIFWSCCGRCFCARCQLLRNLPARGRRPPELAERERRSERVRRRGSSPKTPWRLVAATASTSTPGHSTSAASPKASRKSCAAETSKLSDRPPSPR